jgi:hypothetical protein
MSEYYDGAADHATYEGHDAYQGDQHDGQYDQQYAEVQEHVHHVIELIGEKIEGIEHEVYDEPQEHDAQPAYASDEYQADDHKGDDYKADDYKGDEQYSPYARS